MKRLSDDLGSSKSKVLTKRQFSRISQENEKSNIIVGSSSSSLYPRLSTEERVATFTIRIENKIIEDFIITAGSFVGWLFCINPDNQIEFVTLICILLYIIHNSCIGFVQAI